MSDLEEKLKELLSDNANIKHCCGQSGTTNVTGDIKQITQAFKDAGWLDVVSKGMDPNATYLVVPQDWYAEQQAKLGYMIGQEWYDRFIGELASLSGGGQLFRGTGIDEAAKKASGIQQ